MLGENASPFIDEGDGHTSERERVCMLLILVAHAGGYRMMVGTHNTVWMSDACGRLCCLLWVWQTSALATLLVPGGMQGVLPRLPGTVNADAHNTVDAQRHVGGGAHRMGVNGAYNTVGKKLTSTTLFVSGRLKSTVAADVQGMVPVLRL